MMYGVTGNSDIIYLLLHSQHFENQDDYLESEFEELVSSRFM
jgi:hypothetical protein